MKSLKSSASSAIVQAFVGSILAVALLFVLEPTRDPFSGKRTFNLAYVMHSGGGTTFASVVFIGILAYRLLRDRAE
jgi:hypothetical protein